MRLTMLAPAILLAGCAAAVAPPPVLDPGADTCGAGALAGLVGQPATALERRLIMRPVRLVRGGQAADPVRPDRITFHIAIPTGTPAETPPRVAERIAGVTCG